MFGIKKNVGYKEIEAFYNGIYCVDIHSCTEEKEHTKSTHRYDGEGIISGPIQKNTRRAPSISIGEDSIETTEIIKGITGLFPFIKYSYKTYTDAPITIRALGLGKRSLKKKKEI